MADIQLDSNIAKWKWDPASGPVKLYRVCDETEHQTKCWTISGTEALVTPIDGTQHTLTVYAYDKDLNHGPPSPQSDTLTFVPEPSTPLLLLAGVVGLMLFRRFK